MGSGRPLPRDGFEHNSLTKSTIRLLFVASATVSCSFTSPRSIDDITRRSSRYDIAISSVSLLHAYLVYAVVFVWYFSTLWICIVLYCISIVFTYRDSVYKCYVFSYNPSRSAYFISSVESIVYNCRAWSRIYQKLYILNNCLPKSDHLGKCILRF